MSDTTELDEQTEEMVWKWTSNEMAASRLRVRIRELVATARLEERERCAEIAERFFYPNVSGNLRVVAAAIRTPKGEN